MDWMLSIEMIAKKKVKCISICPETEYLKRFVDVILDFL